MRGHRGRGENRRRDLRLDAEVQPSDDAGRTVEISRWRGDKGRQPVLDLDRRTQIGVIAELPGDLAGPIRSERQRRPVDVVQAGASRGQRGLDDLPGGVVLQPDRRAIGGSARHVQQPGDPHIGGTDVFGGRVGKKGRKLRTRDRA